MAADDFRFSSDAQADFFDQLKDFLSATARERVSTNLFRQRGNDRDNPTLFAQFERQMAAYPPIMGLRRVEYRFPRHGHPSLPLMRKFRRAIYLPPVAPTYDLCVSGRDAARTGQNGGESRVVDVNLNGRVLVFRPVKALTLEMAGHRVSLAAERSTRNYGSCQRKSHSVLPAALTAPGDDGLE
jgi:hypothetical protein